MVSLDYCIHLDLSYWWMFFVAVLIATVGNASGVGGGPFFSTIFLLLLHLPPQVAVGTSMLTKAFGLSSGSYAYWKKELIDFDIAKKLLVVAIPAALLGSYLTGMVNPIYLTAFIALVILLISYSIWKSPKEEELKGRPGREAVAYRKQERRLTNSFDYLINMFEGSVLVGFGAFLDGLTSASLGEFNNYFLIVRSRVPAKSAVATSIFIIACISIVSAAVYLLSAKPPDLSIALFTIPGVMIGAQLGARLSTKLNPNTLKQFISVVLVIVSILLIIKVISSLVVGA